MQMITLYKISQSVAMTVFQFGGCYRAHFLTKGCWLSTLVWYIASKYNIILKKMKSNFLCWESATQEAKEEMWVQLLVITSAGRGTISAHLLNSDTKRKKSQFKIFFERTQIWFLLKYARFLLGRKVVSMTQICIKKRWTTTSRRNTNYCFKPRPKSHTLYYYGRAFSAVWWLLIWRRRRV